MPPAFQFAAAKRRGLGRKAVVLAVLVLSLGVHLVERFPRTTTAKSAVVHSVSHTLNAQHLTCDAWVWMPPAVMALELAQSTAGCRTLVDDGVVREPRMAAVLSDRAPPVDSQVVTAFSNS